MVGMGVMECVVPACVFDGGIPFSPTHSYPGGKSIITYSFHLKSALTNFRGCLLIPKSVRLPEVECKSQGEGVGITIYCIYL